MEHLDRMSLTVGQLKLTGIGKPLKKIRKWLTERETTTGSSENSACELAQCDPYPYRSGNIVAYLMIVCSCCGDSIASHEPARGTS